MPSTRHLNVPDLSEGRAIEGIRYFATILLVVLEIAVFLRAMLSWFPMDQGSPVIRILDDITEPLLRPLRRVVPRVGMIDITPMVAMLVLYVLIQAVGAFPG
jgi:YggT family protein